jgi:hypothetical protein
MLATLALPDDALDADDVLGREEEAGLVEDSAGLTLMGNSLVGAV